MSPVAGRRAAAGLALAGCTSDQMYATGQSWQRNQCMKLPDRADQERCLQRAEVPQDTYRPSADPKAPR